MPRKLPHPGVVWGIDFQFDVDEQGKAIKICSIVDEHTKICVGGLVERRIPADKLIDHLQVLIGQHGAPQVLRCNGPELISNALATWAEDRVGLYFIPPGQPWRNGYIESFNARLRDECLNINSFYSLLRARTVISDWKHNYNHHRRHSSLGYLTPMEYVQACAHEQQTEEILT